MTSTEITSTVVNKLEITYRDAESQSELVGKNITVVRAFCFCEGKLAIVYQTHWELPGGMVDPGETPEEAIVREIKEETSMRVRSQCLLGYEDVVKLPGSDAKTVVFFCCIVTPYGPFVADPDGGEVTEMKLVDSEEYEKYLDQEAAGEHMMRRALEVKLKNFV